MQRSSARTSPSTGKSSEPEPAPLTLREVTYITSYLRGLSQDLRTASGGEGAKGMTAVNAQGIWEASQKLIQVADRLTTLIPVTPIKNPE